MYYLELIQRCWDFNRKINFGSTAIALYLYLLKIGYDSDRYDFKISDIVVSKELGLTRKTVKSTKEKLRDLGLIQYRTQNGFACCYRLILDYPLLTSESEKLNEKKVERKGSIQEPEVLEIQSGSILPTKDTDENFPDTLNQATNERYSQVIKLIYDNKNIPTIEEFIEYAQTLETYDPQLDSGIKEKYEIWVNNGWKNNSDRPITNWKSSLKSTLPYMKNITGDNSLFMQIIPSIRRPKPLNEKSKIKK